MDAPVPGLEPAFDVDAALGPLEDHGETRAGHRRVIPIVGGTIRGLFDADILPGVCPRRRDPVSCRRRSG